MPGRPGSGGPVPKRSDQRRRRNKAEPVARVPARSPVRVPEPDEGWHPIAVEWFRSLGTSGQHVFYEDSDWATARYVAEAMSRNLKAGSFSATLFQSVTAAMTELLTTEGARRRVRVELERSEPPEPASVKLMEEYRRAAGRG